jgi:hypothetical protein
MPDDDDNIHRETRRLVVRNSQLAGNNAVIELDDAATHVATAKFVTHASMAPRAGQVVRVEFSWEER